MDHRIDRYPHDNGNGIVGMGGWGGGVVKRLVKRWTGLTSGNDGKLTDSCFVIGQTDVILSLIDDHYKWPQSKIYSYVSYLLKASGLLVSSYNVIWRENRFVEIILLPFG